MSLATNIGAGVLLGGVLAAGLYGALAPGDAVPASTSAEPTFGPVPTPTVTKEAENCVSPAVLKGDECVVTVPGPTVTLAARTPEREAAVRTYASTTSSGTTTTTGTSSDPSSPAYQEDDQYEHEDGEHEDHEDGDSEDQYEHEGGGD